MRKFKKRSYYNLIKLCYKFILILIQLILKFFEKNLTKIFILQKFSNQFTIFFTTLIFNKLNRII